MRNKQGIPLFLTIVTFLFLSVFLWIFLQVLNAFPISAKIKLLFIPVDILIGITIYLKTSIDFSLFMGGIMKENPGWQKRIAIEIGTALGNALGIILVLVVWFFFKEAPLLMIIMIFLASIILLRMAEQGLVAFLEERAHTSRFAILHAVIIPLQWINAAFTPLLDKLLPPTHGLKSKSLSFWHLLIFSFTIPFLLGLDDFAGYIPLFTLVNVFSFSIGVFFAHMILNMGLFAFPKKTVYITHHPVMVISGSIAFIVIALLGFYDIISIVFRLL